MTASSRHRNSEGFVVLPENRLAVQAVKSIWATDLRQPVPLVTLVAPSGYGKSELARETVRRFEKSHDDAKVVLVTASQFAAQLAEASESRSVPQFQVRHRKDVKLFVCEDMQVLGPRKETQQQLTAAIDEVLLHRGRVLLTSTVMPGRIKGLSRRLVNRMHGGLCVNLELPGAASRKKLIEHFLQLEALPLSATQIEQISQCCEISPRELMGLLRQLTAERSGQRGKGLSQASLERIIEDRQQNEGANLVTIAKVTAQRYGVKVADLKGPRRSQTISLARQTAMYLAREMAKLNYEEIGSYFNRANHSTVIHACRKLAALRQEDPRIDHQIISIRHALGEP